MTSPVGGASLITAAPHGCGPGASWWQDTVRRARVLAVGLALRSCREAPGQFAASVRGPIRPGPWSIVGPACAVAGSAR